MTLFEKIADIKSLFSSLPSSEILYQKIMDFGKELPPFKEEWKKEENRVLGCQSLMYLYTQLQGNQMHFFASSDALISKGLATLLIKVYSGEPPESILLSPPDFLNEIGLPSLLSPGRSNGLASLYLRMKQEALHSLVQKK